MAKRHPSSRPTVSGASPPAFWASTGPAWVRLRRSSQAGLVEARKAGGHEARLRPVTAIVAIGVEVACEWPVFVLAAGALIAYYVPDWRDAARIWLRHHRAGELVTLEITVLLILVTAYLLQRLARSGFVSHRVRPQWPVAV